MAYCPRCGAAAQSQFCGACGAPVFPQIPQQPSPPARARRRWPWFVGIGVPIWLDAAYFFYQDNERTFAEARNRGVDILSTDEKTGMVTARDKLTGKIIALDLNDIEPDAIRPPVVAPPLPTYPHATISRPARDGPLRLTTPDPITKVADCYEVQLRKVGLEVAEGIVPPGGPASRVTLNGTGAGSGRKVTVIIQGGNRGTWVESIE